MLLIKEGHLVWSRAAWSHGWSGWAMPLLIDVKEDEGDVGTEGDGWGWGDFSTDARMVRGEGGVGCSRYSANFFRRASTSARRAAISAEHVGCCLGGGHEAVFSVDGAGRVEGTLGSGLEEGLRS